MKSEARLRIFLSKSKDSFYTATFRLRNVGSERAECRIPALSGLFW